jgi:hypothetical protein
MRFHTLRDRIINKINIGVRLRFVCMWYIISLMIETRKHSLTFASEMSGMGKAAFCKFLKNNHNIAAYTLENLSRREAKRYSAILKKSESFPWKIFVLADSTIQERSSLKTENVQRFDHGQGYVIGHQWTNILLFFNGIIIPLRPIPFYSKKYCRQIGCGYETEHDKLAEYLNKLNPNDYIGSHKESEVVFLSDSGYDCKKIQNAVLKKKWHFIGALKSSRSIKAEATYALTPKSSGWDGIAVFFRKNRRIGWKTVRIITEGPKRKRKEFRVRHADVFLKGVGKVRAVCSEFKRKRDGRRKYLACSDLKATPRQILIAYRLRWKIEIFHKNIKMFLGFGDVSAEHFSSVESHVYLVYCAYLLLQSDIMGDTGTERTVPEKQHKVGLILEKKKIAAIVHELTKIGGADRVKNQFQSALAA